MNIIGLKSVSFYNCSLFNNEARQAESPRSLHKDGFTSPYLNGDGGGIQIGFECNMNEIDIKFENCNFKKNKAKRHGGALAIQTLKTVEINKCSFELNEANFQFSSSSSSELLTENHYDKKNSGKGGAIYINPSYYYTTGSADNALLILIQHKMVLQFMLKGMI